MQVAAVTALALGLLVFALPHRESKEKAYVAAMKGNLRNLVTAQEAYFAEHAAYAPAVSQLAPYAYGSTTGVTLVLEQATPTGWKATASHLGTTYRCAIFVGTVPPPRTDAEEGYPICWSP